MTGDAIVHRQRFERSRRRMIESFHGSMARLASELGYSDVDAMREEHMRRQAPHALPGNFLALLTIGFEFLYLRVFGIAAGMTSQTKSRGRSASREIFLRALMAPCASDFLFDMSLVWKLDRLLDSWHTPIRPEPDRQSSNNNCTDQDDSFHSQSCGDRFAGTLLDCS